MGRINCEINSERWLSLEDFEGEVWRDIQEYKDLYQVSNCGRIRSLERKVEKSDGKMMRVSARICKVWINKGYVYVTLSKSGKQSNCKVHRLVAEAFIANPYNYPDVNHKDEVRTNNMVSNLEWCTKEYNRKYGTCLNRMKKTWRTLHGVSIIRYNIDGTLSKRYDCSIDLSADGFDRRAVYRCCKNENLTHKGYRWKFLNRL